MKRRVFLVGLAAASTLVVVAGPGMAASYAEDIIAQLTKLGFSNISDETTWLGRIKIVATRSDGIREIVLNPRTGEILRDVWSPVSGGGVTRNVLDDVNGSGGGDDGGNSSGDGGGDDSSGSGGDSGGGDDGNSGPGGGYDDGRDREDRGDRND